MSNLENVYDNEIQPLMRQVRAICHAKGIVMVAGFQLDDDAQRGRLLGSSVVVPKGCEIDDDRIQGAVDALQPQESVLAVTMISALAASVPTEN